MAKKKKDEQRSRMTDAKQSAQQNRQNVRYGTSATYSTGDTYKKSTRQAAVDIARGTKTLGSVGRSASKSSNSSTSTKKSPQTAQRVSQGASTSPSSTNKLFEATKRKYSGNGYSPSRYGSSSARGDDRGVKASVTTSLRDKKGINLKSRREIEDYDKRQADKNRENKIDQTVRGSAKQFVGGHIASVGTSLQEAETTARSYNKAKVEKEKPNYSLRSREEAERREQNIQKTIGNKEGVNIRKAERVYDEYDPNGLSQKLIRKGDRLIESGSRDIEKAKEGTGAVGRLAVDLGSNALQMAGDRMMAFVPGVGQALAMGSLMNRAGGTASYEARQDGMNADQQFMYQQGTALIEGLSEGIFNSVSAFQSTYGKGAFSLADKVSTKMAASNIVQNFLKTPTGKAFATNLARLGAQGFEEGIEEVVADIAEPALKYALIKSTDPSAKFEGYNVKDIAYDFMIGALMGGLPGGVEAMRGVSTDVQMSQAMADGKMSVDNLISQGLVQGREGANRTNAEVLANQMRAMQEQGKEIQPIQVRMLQNALGESEISNALAFEKRGRAETERATEEGRLQASTGTAIEESAYERGARAVEEKNMERVNTAMGEDSSEASRDALGRVLSGTADIDDHTTILADSKARETVEELTGEKLSMNNAKARDQLETLTLANEIANKDTLRKEVQTAHAEDIAKELSSMDRRGGELFKQNYDEAVRVIGSGTEYLDVFQRLYTDGTVKESNFDEAYNRIVLQRGGAVAEFFTEPMARKAFNAGRVAIVAEEGKAIAKSKANKSAETGSGISFEGNAKNKISKRQADLLGKFAERANVHIRVVEHIDTGDGGEANGMYKDGIIYIAADSDNKLITVAKHELTHHIRQTAPERYQELEDFVFQRWYNSDADAMENKVAKYQRWYDCTAEEAREEIIADASEAFFTDEAAIQEALSFSEKLGKAIHDGIHTLLDNFLDIQGEDTLKDKGYGEFLKDIDILRDAEQMWLKALDESANREKSADSTLGRNDSVPTREQIESGNATYGGIPIKYDSRLTSDARNYTSEVHVSDKFFNHAEDEQRSILNHEVAHNLSDELMDSHTEDWSDFASKFITEKKYSPNSDAYRSGKRTYQEGLYGDMGATALSETVTHAITEYLDDPSKLKNRSKEAYKEIDSFMRGEETEAKKSLKARDESYLDAVNRGDMETAQKMVDEEAKKHGYDIKAYHGTNAEFTRFDPNKLGSKNWMASSARMGFFASASKETAESYTGLNSMDTAVLAFGGESQEFMRKIQEKYDFINKDAEIEKKREEFFDQYKDEHGYYEEVKKPIEDAKKRLKRMEANGEQNMAFLTKTIETMEDWNRIEWNKKHLNDMHHAWEQTDTYKEHQKLSEKIYKEWEQYEIKRRGYVPHVLNLYLKMERPFVHDFKGEGRDAESFASRMAQAKEEGYDGCIFKNVADGADLDDIYTVFSNTQLKSSDPVTYDDNGNVIPLSERFNEKNDDIRYSKKEKPNSLKDIKEKYKDDTKYLFLNEHGNTIQLSNIVVNENSRNNGIGQNFLNDLTAYADANGKTITLTPTTEYGTKNRLTNWYKKNGFVENKGRNADLRISDTMYRLPRVNAKFSKKEDQTYLDAVNNGDMKTAQRMVDEEAKRHGYDSPKLYHGTPLKMQSASRWKLSPEEYSELGEQYDDKIFPFVVFNTSTNWSKLTYTATNRDVAKNFTYPTQGTVFGLYARMDNPLRVNEHVYSSVPFYDNIPTPSVMKKKGIEQDTLSTEEIAHWAKDNGYDGVIVEGLREGGGIYTDDYIVFSSSQLKSADPVVYDNKGEVIPLSERFNPENEDIRYSRKDSEGNEPERRITEYSTGAYSGQVDMRMESYDGDNLAGSMQYSVYDGTPNIQYIHTESNYRGQGVAREMLQRLQSHYPNTEINWGMTTPDGTKLKENVTYEVRDKKVTRKKKRLQSMKKEISENEKEMNDLWEKAENRDFTEEERSQMQSLGKRWDKLNRDIHNLEIELEDAHEVTYMVKMDDNAKFSLKESESEETETEKAKEDATYKETTATNIHNLDRQNAIVNTKNGEPVAQFEKSGAVQFSLKTYEADGRRLYQNYLKKMVRNGELSQKEADQMYTELEAIYKISREFADSGKFAPFTAWSEADVVVNAKGKPVFSSVKRNSEYKMNMDFSTVCKKRRTLDNVFRVMINRGLFEELDLNKEESAALIVNINDLIREHGFEAACALCFVEARRYRQQQTATTFRDMWNGLVESMYEDKSKIAYFNYGEDDTVADVPDGIHTMQNSELDLSHIRAVANERKPDGKLMQTAEAKAARLILKDPSQRKLMRVGDMMASTGFENMQVKNPQLMKIYNAKKGTGGAKSSFGDVQYLNEIIGKKTFDRMKAYAVSGVRIQSFSDYVPRMVFDYVQMIADLSVKRLPAHAYTKEVLFVKQFGLTGVKINMSLVPDVVKGGVAPGLDKNGDYVWNNDGTFPYEDAIEIQKAEGYKENCGTIAVGISDEQIKKMLADPEIQMVIPYHKSSLNPLVAQMTNVDRFTDYTDFQNTRDKNGNAVAKEFDWDTKLFYLSHDKNGKLMPKSKWGNIQDLVQEYVDWCNEHEYTPKFDQFLYMEDGSINPGYYKMLEDFALLDNDGNFKPQDDVRMRFPTEGSAFGSMADLIESGLSEDTELETKRAKEIEGIVDEIEGMIEDGSITKQSIFSEALATKMEDSDGKFSRKESTSSETLSTQNTIAKLEEQVADLKAEFKRTNLKTANQKDVRVQAGRLIQRHGSNMQTQKSLMDTFNKIFSLYKEKGTDAFDEVYELARDEAVNIVNNIGVIHNEGAEEYKAIKQYLRETPIQIDDAMKRNITDYNDFHKKNFGRLKLVNGETSNIDNVYMELMELFPEQFTEDYTNPHDQLNHIVDVLDNFAPYYESLDGASEEMQDYVVDIASDIMETAYGLQTKKTFADRKYEEKVKAVAKAREEALASRNRALERQRNRYEKKLDTLKEKHQDFKAETRENAEKKRRIKQISNVYKRLLEKLQTPSDTKHLPDGYEPVVSNVLKMFDFTTPGMMRWAGRHGEPTKRYKYMTELRKQLDEMSKNDNGVEVDPDLLELVDEITADIGENQKLIDLDSRTLEDIATLFRAFEHQMNTYNKAFDEANKKTVSDTAHSIFDHLDETKKSKWKLGIMGRFLTSNFNPSDFFELVGGDIANLYNATRLGFDKYVDRLDNAKTFLQDMVDNKKADKWANHVNTFKTASGEEIKLTDTQLMSLYCLNKREQAQGHIYVGGIVSAPLKVKGKLTARELEKTRVIPSLEDLGNWFNTLTDEQKKVADNIQRYFVDEVSDWGNETSMKLYNYKKFGEENYFPIQSSSDYMASNFDQRGTDPVLKNMGMTKALTKNASNAIVVDDIFTVYSKHVAQMASYNAYVPAITDFQRVWNYTEGNDQDMVKARFEDIYGKKAADYIENFFKNLNGVYKANFDPTILDKGLGLFKKAAVGGNIRVLVQQPTAIARASLIINPAYLTAAMPLATAHPKRTYKEMMDHCPIARWKTWGFYSSDITSASRDLKNIMIGKDALTDKIFMDMYGTADNVTWTVIFKACELQVEAQNKGLEKGSDEYWTKVNELASRVFDRTQVVDSPFHRSEIMKSQNGITKMATAFMAEPTKTINMLNTEITKAAVELKNGHPARATGIFVRVGAVITANAAALAVAQAMVDALRHAGGDDDKDKGDYKERFKNYWKDDFKDNLNPLGMIPYVKDVWSQWQGYDVLRMDMTGVSKVVQSIHYLQKYYESPETSKYSAQEEWTNLALSTMYAIGVPISNAKRDIEGLYVSIMEGTGHPEVFFHQAKRKYQLNDKTKGSFTDMYYDALQRGDRKTANEIYRFLIQGGITEKYIKQRKRTWNKHQSEE